MSLHTDEALEASFQAAEQAKLASKELLKHTVKYRETTEAACKEADALAKQLHAIYTSDWIKESPHIDVAKYLRYLGTSFTAVNSMNLKMAKDMEKDVVVPLQNFTNYDFLEMHDAKKKVASTANDYEAMRQKIENAMITQSKKSTKGRSRKTGSADMSALVEQYNTELERLREEQDQNQKSLSQILVHMHQKKETKLLKHMLTLLDLQYNYHEKAFKLLTHLRQKMADLHLQLDESCKEINAGTKEGHLQLKTSGGFQKYWFVLKDGFLSCYKGKKDVSSADLSLNIMYCTTRIPMKPKSANEKGATFEIVTPDKKKPLVLQAESEDERSMWVAAIQSAISEQLNLNEPAVATTDNDTLVFKILKSVEGNNVCADCGAPDPDWASINLGILVCLECSGVHRSVGAHISKVRSTTLDTKAWEPELVLFMTKIGNRRFNDIYEANITGAGYTKPTPDSERSLRERYIRAKYADKLFFANQNRASPDELGQELYNLVCEENDRTVDVFKLIVEGANMEWKNPNDEDKCAVHAAVVFDKLLYLEIMLLNGASIFCLESRKWTPMHYAAYYHRVHCAVVLHKNGFSGAKQLECKDWQNKTAIELAFVGQCEDIVAILNGEKKIGVGFTVEDLDPEIRSFTAAIAQEVDLTISDDALNLDNFPELPVPPPDSVPELPPTPEPVHTPTPLFRVQSLDNKAEKSVNLQGEDKPSRVTRAGTGNFKPSIPTRVASVNNFTPPSPAELAAKTNRPVSVFNLDVAGELAALNARGGAPGRGRGRGRGAGGSPGSASPSTPPAGAPPPIPPKPSI